MGVVDTVAVRLHSSAFPRAHRRKNSPMDAATSGLIRLPAGLHGGVTLALTGDRRRASSPASTAPDRSTHLPLRLPPPALEEREREMWAWEDREEEGGDLPRQSRIRAGGAPCAAAGSRVHRRPHLLREVNDEQDYYPPCYSEGPPPHDLAGHRRRTSLGVAAWAFTEGAASRVWPWIWKRGRRRNGSGVDGTAGEMDKVAGHVHGHYTFVSCYRTDGG
jgi:hypothetical protein